MIKLGLVVSLLATLPLMACYKHPTHPEPTAQTSLATQPTALAAPSSSQVTADEAGDFRQLSTSEVAQLSQRIVLAECRKAEVKQLASGNIFTFIEFKTLRLVKGQMASDQFTLRILGGRVGNVEITSPLKTNFAPNSKYVLFLGRDNAEGYPTISPQAIFAVRTNSLDKSEVVAPNPSGLKLYRAKDGEEYSAAPELLPLEDFLISLTKLLEK